jgi:hypothetical protein
MEFRLTSSRCLFFTSLALSMEILGNIWRIGMGFSRGFDRRITGGWPFYIEKSSKCDKSLRSFKIHSR